jgi:hypothetical protein
MNYTHDQHTLKALTIAVIIFFLGMFLTGCAKPKPKATTSEPTFIDTIANLGKTGKVIGCVFAPWSKECKSIREDAKKPHQTQEEYLEEVNDDFDKLDKELKSN